MDWFVVGCCVWFRVQGSDKGVRRVCSLVRLSCPAPSPVSRTLSNCRCALVGVITHLLNSKRSSDTAVGSSILSHLIFCSIEMYLAETLSLSPALACCATTQISFHTSSMALRRPISAFMRTVSIALYHLAAVSSSQQWLADVTPTDLLTVTPTDFTGSPVAAGFPRDAAGKFLTVIALPSTPLAILHCPRPSECLSWCQLILINMPSVRVSSSSHCGRHSKQQARPLDHTCSPSGSRIPSHCSLPPGG